MPLRSTLALAVSLLAPGVLSAQANTFELHVGGKSVGKASYTLSPAKQDYKLTSRYTYRLGAQEADFLDEYRFDPAYAYLDGTTTDSNSQRKLSFIPNRSRTELSVSSFLGGAEPTTFVPVKPNLVILPNFDPGAAQVILLAATTHPTPDNKYNVFLPSIGSAAGGGGGRRGGAAPAAPDPRLAADDAMPAANAAYDAVWIKGRDLTGTLDDKPLAVHTYLLGFGKLKWIFFADDANHLLQLNVSALHASYIRARFKLDPIAAPAPGATPGSSPGSTSPPSQ